MAEKICCPGPLGTSGGNTASGGAFREAVCVHTSKVYDSCRSKECLRDIRVYLTRDAQDMLDSGGIVSVKPRAAALQSYTQKTTASRRWFSHIHLKVGSFFRFLSPLQDVPPDLPDPPGFFELPELSAAALPLAIAPALAEPL